MLSLTAEYAVRAVIVLARHHGVRAVSAEEIAVILGAPRNYLAKTLNALVRAGVLASARGPGGGFTLIVSPSELTVAAVADVFAEARPARARCLLSDGPCNALRPCAAHMRWTQLTITARSPLMQTVIAELSGESRSKRVAGRP